MEFGRKLEPDNCTPVEPLPAETVLGVTPDSIGEGFDTPGSYNSAVFPPGAPPMARTLLLFSKTAAKKDRDSFIKSTSDQVPVLRSKTSVLLLVDMSRSDTLPPMTRTFPFGSVTAA